eukprot:6924417-Prymnesium_polylepis.1
MNIVSWPAGRHGADERPVRQLRRAHAGTATGTARQSSLRAQVPPVLALASGPRASRGEMTRLH